MQIIVVMSGDPEFCDWIYYYNASALVPSGLLQEFVDPANLLLIQLFMSRDISSWLIACSLWSSLLTPEIELAIMIPLNSLTNALNLYAVVLWRTWSFKHKLFLASAAAAVTAAVLSRCFIWLSSATAAFLPSLQCY